MADDKHDDALMLSATYYMLMHIIYTGHCIGSSLLVY